MYREVPLDRCDPAQNTEFVQGWREFSDREYYAVSGRRFDLRFVRDVRGNRESQCAGAFYLGAYGGQPAFATRQQRNASAGTCERLSRCATDAAGSASDDDDFIGLLGGSHGHLLRFATAIGWPTSWPA